MCGLCAVCFAETHYNSTMLWEKLIRGKDLPDEGAWRLAESINALLVRHMSRIVSRLGSEQDYKSGFKHARDTRIPAIPDDVENIVAARVADLLVSRVAEPTARRDLLVSETSKILPTILAHVPSAEVIVLAAKISSRIDVKLLREAVKQGVLVAQERAVERLDPRIPELSVRERQMLDHLTHNCIYDLPMLQQLIDTMSRGQSTNLSHELLPNFLTLFDFLEEREDPKWRTEAQARAEKILSNAFLEAGTFGGKFNIEKKSYEKTF